jgi:hypothetical protein
MNIKHETNLAKLNVMRSRVRAPKGAVPLSKAEADERHYLAWLKHIEMMESIATYGWAGIIEVLKGKKK